MKKQETLDSISGFFVSEAELVRRGLTKADIEYYRYNIVDNHALLQKQVDALEKSVSAKTFKLLYECRKLLGVRRFIMKFFGIPVHEIPKNLLREIRNTYIGSDSVERKYKERIKNRATAIRGFCVQCMGGNTQFVRDCGSFTCPLWPFRMGTDPFRGHELPAPDNVYELELGEPIEDIDDDEEDDPHAD